MRTFLLDDKRDIPADVTCKTATAAYIALERLPPFDLYYFDNDLGSTKPGAEGYDVLNWALQKKLIPVGAHVRLTTNNPVAIQRMTNALVYNGFLQFIGYFKRGE